MLLHRFTGNENIKTSLSGAIASGRLSHGLLLSGEKGMGVNCFALLLAADITGSKDIKAIADGRNPLVQIIRGEGASGLIKVEKIRRINENVNFSSISGEKRVIIIENCENFNANSANALLKNLEEPKNDTTYILTTNKPSAILATIRSRCSMYTLNSPTKGQTEEYFRQNGYNMGQVATLMELYGENIGKIKSRLDNEKRYRLLQNALAVYNRAAKGDGYTVAKVCYGYNKAKEDFRLMLEDLKDIFHRNMSAKSVRGINTIQKYTEFLSTNRNLNLIIENFSIEIAK